MSKKTATDRISLLPDTLLHHILSFLNTESVVQTCVLSKRWKILWKSIPTLIFDFPSFQIGFSRPPLKRYQNRTAKENAKLKSFNRFILQVLSHYSPTSFKIKHLTLSYPEYGDFLFKHIDYFAAWHHVDELNINCSELNFLNWSCCLRRCRSVKLKGFLEGSSWISLTSYNLKTLEIENDNPTKPLNFEGDLFSYCPDLQHLVLRGHCSVRNAKITAPKLEYLEMKFKNWDINQFPKIELSTPNLESVKFHNLLPVLKSTDNLSNIDKVDLSLPKSCFSPGSSSDKNQRVAQKLTRLLKVLQNATTLVLELVIAEVLSCGMEEEEVLNFYKLKHLKLKTNYEYRYMITVPSYAMGILTRCPSLQSMKIELPTRMYGNPGFILFTK